MKPVTTALERFVCDNAGRLDLIVLSRYAESRLLRELGETFRFTVGVRDLRIHEVPITVANWLRCYGLTQVGDHPQFIEIPGL